MAVSKQWAMIRSWLRKTHNKEVHEFFKDLPANLDPDNTSGRSTTKAVCLIGAGDSQGIAEIKMRNFESLKKKVGIDSPPTHDYELLPDISIKGKAQVQLWFWEKLSTAKRNNRQQARARVSFRIMDERWTPVEAQAMALKIRNKFARPIYSFEKGEEKVTYYDSDKGHRFILTAEDKAEGKRVIADVFDMLGQIPNWNCLRKSTSEKDFDAPETIKVYDKSIKTSPSRPDATVYFKYAIAKLPYYPEEIALVDTSGTYPKAFYKEPNTYLNSEPRVKAANYYHTPLF